MVKPVRECIMALVETACVIFPAIMDLPPPPPPLPAAKKNRLWIVLSFVGAFCAIAIVAAVFFGITTFQRVREKAIASREARQQIEKTTDEEREKMADRPEWLGENGRPRLTENRATPPVGVRLRVVGGWMWL